MHPCPIGRGLSLLSNLFDLDFLYTSLIASEEEPGTQSLLLLSPGRVLWGRFETIGSGTASLSLAFRGVKVDTLLTLESRRGRRSAWG